MFFGLMLSRTSCCITACPQMPLPPTTVSLCMLPCLIINVPCTPGLFLSDVPVMYMWMSLVGARVLYKRFEEYWTTSVLFQIYRLPVNNKTSMSHSFGEQRTKWNACWLRHTNQRTHLMSYSKNALCSYTITMCSVDSFFASSRVTNHQDEWTIKTLITFILD